MHCYPKKSLGQNFLFDQNIQRKIIAACQLKAADEVLEIGAGRGDLTRLIAPAVKKIYAVEIDQNLVAFLKERLKGYAQVEIIQRDILKFDLNKYFSRNKAKIKVIGNIPYYITTPIIANLLKYRRLIDTIFLTLQKEVAERITATSGTSSYGAFSCFVQYYTQAKILFRIKKTSFYPAPKVDSCFLQLKVRAHPRVCVKDEGLFFEIIRTSFQQRRKTLRNSLKRRVAEKKLELFFKKYGIKPDIRPQDLSLEDFARLARFFA